MQCIEYEPSDSIDMLNLISLQLATKGTHHNELQSLEPNLPPKDTKSLLKPWKSGNRSFRECKSLQLKQGLGICRLNRRKQILLQITQEETKENSLIHKNIIQAQKEICGSEEESIQSLCACAPDDNEAILRIDKAQTDQDAINFANDSIDIQDSVDCATNEFSLNFSPSLTKDSPLLSPCATPRRRCYSWKGFSVKKQRNICGLESSSTQNLDIFDVPVDEQEEYTDKITELRPIGGLATQDQKETEGDSNQKMSYKQENDKINDTKSENQIQETEKECRIQENPTNTAISSTNGESSDAQLNYDLQVYSSSCIKEESRSTIADRLIEENVVDSSMFRSQHITSSQVKLIQWIAERFVV